MKVIVCLDDCQGMLFNKRRQSRDTKVVEDVLKTTEKLWINTFSEKMFADCGREVIVDEEFLSQARQGEYCFVENKKLLPYIEEVEEIIVYRWNRKYPSDFVFDVPLQQWKLSETKEFAGKSHEKITREIYIRG